MHAQIRRGTHTRLNNNINLISHRRRFTRKLSRHCNN